MRPSDLLNHWRGPRAFLPLYGLFLSGITLFFLLSSLVPVPVGENAFLFSYSKYQVFIGALFLFFLIAFLIFVSIFIRRPEHTLRWRNMIFENNRVNHPLIWVFALISIFFWILNFLPSYRFPAGIYPYVSRLHLVILWVLTISIVSLIILLYARIKEFTISSLLADKTFRAARLVFPFFILLALLIIWTGIGVRQRGDYWYNVGVPVLFSQVIFSLLAGLLFAWIESKRRINTVANLDRFIFFVIWIFAAWLWVREPLRSSYFFTDTGINHLYPYSDSALFDISSQFALIGQGLFNGAYFERPLYSAFLVYLHSVAGQNTESLMSAQAAIYAVFPALIYLIGNELHSRSFGISAAFLVSLRGVNAIILSPWIDLASPKMMLTDFPTAIGVALLIWLLLKWLKHPAHTAAVWVGAVIGMTLMLRIHALVLLPFILLYMLIVAFPAWRRWVVASLLVIVGMLAVALPWDVRNLSNDTPLFAMYYQRLERLFQDRYGVPEESGYAPSPVLFSSSRDNQQSFARVSREKALRSTQPELCSGRICSVANNFFHNLVTSFIYLPSSFALDDPLRTVRGDVPYWQQDWAGENVDFFQGGFLFFNIMFVSLGAGAAWVRQKWYIAFLPFFIFFAYMAANGLALTSGGRYIVPADWIVSLYYMLGVHQISLGVAKSQGMKFAPLLASPPPALSSTSKFPWIKIIASLVFILLIGFFIPAAELPFEKRYEIHPKRQMLVLLKKDGWLKKIGFSTAEMSTFLDQPYAVAFEGRMLYPRYYIAGKGEAKLTYPYLSLDYARLAFTMIGPYPRGMEGVILSGKRPALARHAEDVIVIGCRNAQFIDGLILIVLSEPDGVYLRSPWNGLTCSK